MKLKVVPSNQIKIREEEKGSIPLTVFTISCGLGIFLPVNVVSFCYVAYLVTVTNLSKIMVTPCCAKWITNFSTLIQLLQLR